MQKLLLSFQKKKIGTKRRRQATINIQDIPALDYILLSHAHSDHRDHDSLEKLTKIFPDAIIICPKNTSKLVHRMTHSEKSIELDREEHHTFPEISFLAFSTKHR